MCTSCCKECRGWCRAFTPTEVLLSILEAILLAVFIGFLTFLILHLIACSDNVDAKKEFVEESFNKPEKIKPNEPGSTKKQILTRTTLSPDVECTWIASEKTTAVTKYYDSDASQPEITVAPTEQQIHSLSQEGTLVLDQTDGEVADDKEHFVLALITRGTGNVILFKCILSIISKFWTLTAASCIDSIGEDVNLDQLFMTEKFGKTTQGRDHMISKIVMHPNYQSDNKTYDVVAIKSKTRLASTINKVLQLPTVIDYYLITIGERLLVLGFGKFRINQDERSHRVHKAAVHVLPSQQCHVRYAEDRPPLCAGALYSRGTPCKYCAGTPLLQGAVLLGVMAANDCGESCEPSLYVNLAIIGDWLYSVIHDQ